MSFNTLTPAAVSSEARPWAGTVWRMMEAQHTASTMKIVDNSEEQDLLETLLEGSKPAQPDSALALDYLLATPFRYYPLRGGSRFRGVTDPGVFYGAESARTASAELGYWRWKFLKDAGDLDRLEPVAHTAFSAQVSTQVIDLRQAPFSANAAGWTHPSDYAATQAMAQVARLAQVGAIHEALQVAKGMHQPIDRIWIDGGNAKNIAAELKQRSLSNSISIEAINGLVLRGLWSWIRQELR